LNDDGGVGANPKMVASHQVETGELKINPVGAFCHRRELIRSVAAGGRADSSTSAFFNGRDEGTGNRPAGGIDNTAGDARRLSDTSSRKSGYREANRHTHRVKSWL
jgi:hypothetical protein